MKIHYLSLIALVASNLQAGIQTGELIFNNTLAQPITYEYSTKPTGVIPGILNAPNGGINVSGRGEIPANTSQAIMSSLKSKSNSVWGDTINVILRKNANESAQFTINQLGTYTINTDQKGTLTLNKS